MLLVATFSPHGTFMSVLEATRPSTMSYMGTKKTPKQSGNRYKPYRSIRIPERLAKLLEELANVDFNTLSDQVREACRDRLRNRGKLPKPDGD